MRPAPSRAILRASLNMPGPMPSSPNCITKFAKLDSSALPPEGLERGMAGTGTTMGGLAVGVLLPHKADPTKVPIAIIKMTMPITGTSTIRRIHLVRLILGPAPRRSILITRAGCVASGTDKELLQYEHLAVRFAPMTSLS